MPFRFRHLFRCYSSIFTIFICASSRGSAPACDSHAISLSIIFDSHFFIGFHFILPLSLLLLPSFAAFDADIFDYFLLRFAAFRHAAGFSFSFFIILHDTPLQLPFHTAFAIISPWLSLLIFIIFFLSFSFFRYFADVHSFFLIFSVIYFLLPPSLSRQRRPARCSAQMRAPARSALTQAAGHAAAKDARAAATTCTMLAMLRMRRAAFPP
jgi:hypothetical protein